MADHNRSTDVSTTPLLGVLNTNHHVSHVCMYLRNALLTTLRREGTFRTWWRPFGFCAATMIDTVHERVTGNSQKFHRSKNKTSSRTTYLGPQVRKDRGEKKQFQCERVAESWNKLSREKPEKQKMSSSSKDCWRTSGNSRMHKKEKNRDEKQPKKIQYIAQHWRPEEQLRWTTSNYRKFSYKTSIYQTSSYIMSRLQNAQVTKRPFYKTSRLQNVRDTKRPVFVNLRTCLKKPFSDNTYIILT